MPTIFADRAKARDISTIKIRALASQPATIACTATALVTKQL
jgi:hypothetical protein